MTFNLSFLPARSVGKVTCHPFNPRMHSYRQDLKDSLLADANGPAVVPKEGPTGNQSVNGALTISGALTVTGTSAFSGSVTATNVLNANGGIKFPTSDPSIVGAWWDNAGVLTKSAG